MSEIRVNTSDLRSGSQGLRNAGDQIIGVKSQVSGLSAHVGNDYDGQLRKDLERILGDGQIGIGLANHAVDLGNELQKRATGFEAANEAGRSAMLASTHSFSDFFRKSPFLKFFASLSPSERAIITFLFGIGGLGTMGIITLITFIPNIRELFSSPVPASSGSTPISPSKPVTDTNLYKPQSPLGDFRVTARFPEYESTKNADGTTTRSIHNGLDLQPKGYNRDKDWNTDFSIKPIGPGKVVRVDTEYVKNAKGEPVLDKDGNKIVTGYGNYIVIQHTLPDGTHIYSRYAHMKAPSTLKTGEMVDSDKQLGIMGTSGNSTGQHVHLEVYKEGAYTGFNSKNPDGKFDPEDPNSPTFLEKMKQQFYDPEPFINGTTDIRFTKSAKG